jgi:tagatose 6-phosphate kinase
LIICLGTTPALQQTMTFERVVIDDVNRAIETRQYASGKPINVARVLHTLGRRPLASGFVGGETGKFIRRDLEEIGLAHDFVEVKSATRICVTMVDRSAGTATELIEESAAVGRNDCDLLLAKLRSLMVQCEGLVLSGKLAPGVPEDFYARCITEAAGKLVILDATGDALRRALPARPTIVKPNQKELAETAGMTINSDASLKDAISKLITAGPKWVVVTAGAGKTVVSDGKQFWRLATPSVHVISPIGSGDSFAAGLVAAVSAGQEVPEACRLAVACGAANAMTPFAGHLRKDDVNALLTGIAVEPF